MNGVHDMGGMHGLGPIRYEKNEPVFHARWEGRVFAMNRAVRAFRKWNVDASRYQIESIPGPEYLRMSYYERWFTSMVALLIKHGMVTQEEIKSGKRVKGSPKATPALTPAQAVALPSTAMAAKRDVAVAAKFRVGQRVRALTINPTGHTRLPRYARGRAGMIDRDHGVFVFPDTSAHALGDKAQHVYSVRFTARELWGEKASARDSVYLDMWDDYLEPA